MRRRVAEGHLRTGKSFRILSFLLLLLLAWLLGQEGVPVEDGPELLTVARLGGTNHPPGMPLLSLLCRTSWILMGDSGLRVLFALMAAASLWLLSDRRGLAGLMLSAGILLLPAARERLLQWDAYGPLFLLFAAGYRFRRADALLAGFLTGLALAVHPMGILMALLWVRRRTPLLRAFCGIALGLSVYLALPLYSAAGAVVDWGSPSDLGSFFRQVTAGGYREVYGPQMGGQALRPLAEHAIVLGKMLWPVLGVMTAIGLVAFIRRHWGIAARLGALLVAEGLFVWLVNPRAAGTSQTGVLSLFALVVLAFASLSLLHAPQRHLLAAAVLISGLLGSRPLPDQRARIEAMLSEAPPLSCFVLQSNDLLYGWWQLKYVEDRRPDVVLLSTGNFSAWFEGMVNHFNPGMDLSTGIADVGGTGLSRSEAAARLVEAARELNPKRPFLTDASIGK